ncbi:MAG: alpha/beta hydrolase [Gemmatimonadaceae bacterium]|nr:alpha/beta hydrolase [Gemmatimonadaceae bacterium]
MNLLFFGSTSRQLFGAYHVPPSSVAGRGAALLCPPWGSEYLVSHRIFRRLAVRLSESGYHVLRFDYFGTGDSAGATTDGDLESWQADAQVALEELRDMSGFSSVATFGIRLGAVVAWRLATTRQDVHTAVLWDPITNGDKYVRELEAAQLDIDRWSLMPVHRDRGVGENRTLLGFPMTLRMRSSIEAVGADMFSQPTKAQVNLLFSDVRPGQEPLHDALRTAGTQFHSEIIPGQTPWRDDEATGAGGLPVLVLERMVEMLR